MERLRKLLLVSLACLLSLALAGAQEVAPQPGFGRGPGQGVGLLGDHAVTLTDTGAVITITSADPAIAARIVALHTGNEAPPYRELPAGVTRTVEALDNGVRITLVGATPESVTWIQKRHATVPAGPPADDQRPRLGQQNGPGFGQGAGYGRGQGGCGGPGLGLAVGPAAGFPAPNHEVVNLENGIRVTITSDNADQIALLQQRIAAATPANCPYAAQVQRSAETVANGVVLTLTSDDAETVAWLQANPPSGPRGNGAGLGQRAGQGAGQGQGRGQGRGRGHGFGNCPNR